MTILVVEDDETFAALVTRMLRKTGFIMRYANSIVTALAQMQVLPIPDLILLDISLDPDGPRETLGALDTFRKINPELKVVVITGMELESIQELCDKAHVEDVLQKDSKFSTRLLLEAVQKQLAACRNTKEVTALGQRLAELLAPSKVI